MNIGEKYGRLKILKLEGRAVWCQCDCNDTICKKFKNKYDIIKGKTKSCGCLRKEETKIRGLNNKNHGMSGSRFYKIWGNAKSRCTNKESKDYSRYGGSGVKFSEKWFDFKSFKEDMYDSYLKHVEIFGEKDTTLDRIDFNGNYEPSNCRWATIKEQNNNKSNCIFVEIDGEVKTLAQWSEISDVKYRKIKDRYHSGVRGKNLIDHK